MAAVTIACRRAWMAERVSAISLRMSPAASPGAAALLGEACAVAGGVGALDAGAAAVGGGGVALGALAVAAGWLAAGGDVFCPHPAATRVTATTTIHAGMVRRFMTHLQCLRRSVATRPWPP